MVAAIKRYSNSNKAISEADSAGDEWAERCRYWRDKTRELIPRRKRREKQSWPLILAGHGISIRVDKGTLLVRDGNTHFPAPINEFRYFPGELNIPSRIILIDGSGNITLGALDWLSEQGVHLIRLKWNGEITNLSTPSGYSGNLGNIQWQLATQANNKARLEFASQLIRRKLEATLFNLENLFPPSKPADRAIKNTISAIGALRNYQPRDLSNLLGFEGGLAANYFAAWRQLPINWKSASQYPIPDEWRKYISRSNLNPKPKNYGATHPINAMLNYAYKVLETNIRIHCIIEGYDPSIGILHTGKRNKYSNEPSFVLDLMEPYRPVIDREIIGIIKNEKLTGADFNIQKDGICRLNPEMACYLVQIASNALWTNR